MLNLFKEKTNKGFKLTKSSICDEWMVKNGSNIMYVGPKEKCKQYIQNH